MPQVIILLGAPAAGKGTQSERLKHKLGIMCIASIDLFRENIRKGTEAGALAKSLIDAGKLVPDEIILKFLFERISRPDAQSGYLLDGFPRTVNQAEEYSKSLSKDTQVVPIYLKVSDETIIKRTEGRLICKECEHIQNKYFAPPVNEGKCDRCSGELFSRKDDARLAVAERLRAYHTQTLPLIDYYQAKGGLKIIDGELPREDVHQQILSFINQTSKF